MRRGRRSLGSGALLATMLVVGGCGSSDQESPAPAPSAGSDGGSPQQITAAGLNTGGDSPGGAGTAAVVTATNAFLATLDAGKRARVVHDFTADKGRQTWSNYPAFTVAREGAQMSELSAAQQKAADAVLKAALSPAGVEQDADIRKADDYLHDAGGLGADGFGSLKGYYIAVYGRPSATEPFMIQFGGHHLARNLTYHGDKVSQTPQFVGAEPPSFTVGGTTFEPMKAEATAMFAMIAGLTADQKTEAQIGSATIEDVLMGPGKDSGPFPAAEGMLVALLTGDQKALITAAIQPFVEDLPSAAATKLTAKYTAELDRTRVGWANNTGPLDENTYLRIDGPSVWIEFVNTRSESTPNLHYHAVYRDKTNDYGSARPG